MEFGWYVEFHRQVEQQSDADAFAQGLDQVSLAEEWGLDAIWLAEIHQQAARSVLSAPLTVAAAGMTGRLIRLSIRLQIGCQTRQRTTAHRDEQRITETPENRKRVLAGAGNADRRIRTLEWPRHGARLVKMVILAVERKTGL